MIGNASINIDKTNNTFHLNSSNINLKKRPYDVENQVPDRHKNVAVLTPFNGIQHHIYLQKCCKLKMQVKPDCGMWQNPVRFLLQYNLYSLH